MKLSAELKGLVPSHAVSWRHCMARLKLRQTIRPLVCYYLFTSLLARRIQRKVFKMMNLLSELLYLIHLPSTVINSWYVYRLALQADFSAL
jgi:hypothetical protein